MSIGQINLYNSQSTHVWYHILNSLMASFPLTQFCHICSQLCKYPLQLWLISGWQRVRTGCAQVLRGVFPRSTSSVCSLSHSLGLSLSFFLSHPHFSSHICFVVLSLSVPRASSQFASYNLLRMCLSGPLPHCLCLFRVRACV